MYDPNGKEIVDPKGRTVTVTSNKNGNLSFSKNAIADIRRVAIALNLTESGRKQLTQLTKSDTKVKINIFEETKTSVISDGKTAYTMYCFLLEGCFGKCPNLRRMDESETNPDPVLYPTDAAFTNLFRLC